jgi:hypothetical protein
LHVDAGKQCFAAVHKLATFDLPESNDCGNHFTKHAIQIEFPGQARLLEMRLTSRLSDEHHCARLFQGGVISTNYSQSSIFPSAMGK